MRNFWGKRYSLIFTILISLLAILCLAACSTLGNLLEQTQNKPQSTSLPTLLPTSTAIILPTVSDTNNSTSNEAGNEGGMTMGEASLLPPLEPIHVNAVKSDNSVEIQWQGTGLDIAVHYLIYRRMAGVEVWEIIATVPVEGDNRGSYSYQDTTIEQGKSYEYALTIVDSFGNESKLSPIMAINSG